MKKGQKFIVTAAPDGGGDRRCRTDEVVLENRDPADVRGEVVSTAVGGLPAKKS
jgi:hypothetical protein